MFNRYNGICEGIFKAASPEEIALRRNDYSYKEILNILKKYGRLNDDGSWDVDGDVDIGGYSLTKIPIRFNKVGGSFWCCSNNLIDLDCSPMYVGRSFYCEDNELVTLKGCPRSIFGNFKCDGNNLTTLEYGPKFVGGSFNCCRNNLNSLVGAPREVGGDFYCAENAIKFSEEDVRSVCKVKGFVIN